MSNISLHRDAISNACIYDLRLPVVTHHIVFLIKWQSKFAIDLIGSDDSFPGPVLLFCHALPLHDHTICKYNELYD